MSLAVLTLFLACAPQLKPWPTHVLAGGPVKSVDGTTLQIPAAKSKATVLLFVDVDCPICNRYGPEINRIVSKYAKSVSFLLAYTDRTVSPEAIRRHRKAYGFTSPAFVDARHVWVQRVGAAVTP